MTNSTNESLNSLVDFYVNNQNNHVKNTMDISRSLSLSSGSNTCSLISPVNKLLQNHENRFDGLVLLNKILPHCPPLEILENSNTWINMCMSYSGKEPANVIVFQIIKQIIATCSKLPDFNKSFINILPKVIDRCISISIIHNTTAVKPSLRCLLACIENYPGSFSPFKNKTESYLIKFLSCSLPRSEIRLAGYCFHYLQQSGISGADGSVHKNNWTNQINRLCATVHKLYEKFLENITEYDSYDIIDAKPIDFLELSFTGPTQLYVIINRLKNVIIFLDMLLIKQYSVEKTLVLDTILNVIKRGLEIDVYEDPSQLHFTTLLYDHQIDLLYLLRSVIVCSKSNLLKFSFIISKLLIDCLIRTQKTYFKSNRIDSSKYQIAVYKVWNVWITTAPHRLTVPTYKKFISHVLLDITPSEDNKTIQLNNAAINSKSSKAKKRSIENKIVTDFHLIVSNAPEKQQENKQVICTTALNTTCILLQNAFLEHEIIKMLYPIVVKQLINLQTGKVLYPYSELKCRTGLYKILAALLRQTNFCMSPAIQVSTSIFVNASNIYRNNEEMYAICTNALDILEKLAQPMLPTLQLEFSTNNSISNQNIIPQAMHNEQDSLLDESNINSSIVENFIDERNCTAVQVQHANPPTDTFQASKRIKILDVQIIPSQKTGGIRNKPTENDQSIEEIKEIDIIEITDEAEEMGNEVEHITYPITNTNINLKESVPKPPVISLQDSSDNEVSVHNYKMETNAISLSKEREISEEEMEMMMLNSFKDKIIQY